MLLPRRQVEALQFARFDEVSRQPVDGGAQRRWSRHFRRGGRVLRDTLPDDTLVGAGTVLQPEACA